MTVKIVSNREMLRIDKVTQDEYRISGASLMENAGIKLWLRLVREESPDRTRPMVFLPGKGNNGGDSLVMARQAFFDGYNPVVLLVSGSLTPEDALEPARPSEETLAAALALGIPVYAWDSPEGQAAVNNASLLVDGLFGVGLRGTVRPPFDAVIDSLNGAGKRIISIDVPSGLYEGFSEGAPCIRASATYAVEYAKSCMFGLSAREYCGTVHTVSIGFPQGIAREDARLISGESGMPPLPAIDETSYKHRRGSCLVFAGGKGTLGAAGLCASASGKAGAGLVRLYTGEEEYPLIAGSMGGVMAAAFEERNLDLIFDRATAFVMGPGLTGISGEAQRKILSAASERDIPGVVDAESLRLFGKGNKNPGRFVLTPHIGEFLKMGFCSRADLYKDPVAACKNAARETGNVIVLKSFCTYIAHPEGGLFVHDGMNHTLGTGGSGDILAGIIGGYLAAGADPITAAVNGVYVHGKAGRMARDARGYYLAEELLDYVGAISLERRIKTE